MLPFAPSLQAVVFDYGNTLVEYGPRQVEAGFAPLLNFLARLGPVDEPLLRAVIDRQIHAPYRNDYHENVMADECGRLLREVMGLEPTPDQVRELEGHRRRTFLDVVEGVPEVPRLLERLGRRYKLALVSNYPCGVSIRQSLAQLGWDHLFSAVVVSGDPGVGRIKPHPLPFQTALAQLGVEPDRCVFVGDNWLADVQGSKRAGMRTIFTTQHLPYERWEPQPGDAQPDARIAHLGELEALLL